MYNFKIQIQPNINTAEVKADIAVKLSRISQDVADLTKEPIKYMIKVSTDDDVVTYYYKTPSLFVHFFIKTGIEEFFVVN